MQFDIFFSICQSEVDGYLPTERTMFKNFFDQVRLADQLGFEVAWVAETHLSCEIQKHNQHPVIPNFKGEIGVNVDILQLAHKVYQKTEKIAVGSAIRNILCNGGPIAHAEAIRFFLSLQELEPESQQHPLHLGFAAGRFPFSVEPYGIKPRHSWEALAWPIIRGKLFLEATEIFCRLLKGEELASSDIPQQWIEARDFRNHEDWIKFQSAWRDHSGVSADQIPLDKFWSFERLGLVPRETNLNQLRLFIGSHDPKAQVLANRFLPCGVFNLSITSQEVIEATQKRMQDAFHPEGGPWQRNLMPQTVMVFLNADPLLSTREQTEKARFEARAALGNYWKAMEGTIDPAKVEQAVDNALCGNPNDVIRQIQERFHPTDRLMLWFDFNNHDHEDVKRKMTLFHEQVRPRL